MLSIYRCLNDYIVCCTLLDVRSLMYFLLDISCRLRMTEMLCNFFRSVIILSPDDLLQCVYLCLNKIAPAYEGVELGIGDSILIKALAEATGKVKVPLP